MWPLKYTHSHTIALTLCLSPSSSCKHLSLLLFFTHAFSPLRATPAPEAPPWESNPLPTACPPAATLQFLSVLLQLNFSSLCAAFLESPPTPFPPYLLHTNCPQKQGHHCLYKITNGLLVMKSQHLYSISTISLILLMLPLLMTLATIYWAIKMVQVVW